MTNKEIMEQFVRFINTGDRALGEPIIDESVVFHAPTSPEPMRGFGGYVRVLDMMRGAMPDVNWTIEEMVAEGDTVMVRFTMRGTQTGPFMNLPPSGKQVCVTAMNLYAFKNGKIVREYGLPDIFSLLLQLGALPLPQ